MLCYFFKKEVTTIYFVYIKKKTIYVYIFRPLINQQIKQHISIPAYHEACIIGAIFQ